MKSRSASAFEGEWSGQIFHSRYRDKEVIYDHDPKSKRLDDLIYREGKAFSSYMDELSDDDWEFIEETADSVDTSFVSNMLSMPDSTNWRSLMTYEMARLALLVRDADEIDDVDLVESLEGELKSLYLERGKRSHDMHHLRSEGLNPESYIDLSMTNLTRMMSFLNIENTGPFMHIQEDQLPIIGGR